MNETNWAAEILKGGITFVSTLLGGGLVMFGAWLSDRRARRERQELENDHEYAILHGAFTVSNFIAKRLNDWQGSMNFAQLARLKIAQGYLEQLIRRSPDNSDRIMITLIDVGLQLDSVLMAVDQIAVAGVSEESIETNLLNECIVELDGSLETLDLLLNGRLPMTYIDEIDAYLGEETDKDGGGQDSSPSFAKV